jgi:cytidyltransferase-like protein
MTKNISFNESSAGSEALSVLGKSIVTTNGTFDLLHVGHMDSLEQSGSLTELLIVDVDSDESVKRDKGHLRPIVPAG